MTSLSCGRREGEGREGGKKQSWNVNSVSVIETNGRTEPRSRCAASLSVPSIPIRGPVCRPAGPCLPVVRLFELRSVPERRTRPQVKIGLHRCSCLAQGVCPLLKHVENLSMKPIFWVTDRQELRTSELGSMVRPARNRSGRSREGLSLSSSPLRT